MGRKSVAWMGVLALGACSSSQKPAPGAQATPAAWNAAWDGLCPQSGASAPSVIRVGESGVRFEPSGGAVWNGRLLVVGDKQAQAWWWTPGTVDVVQDAAWKYALAGTAGPNACCSATPGDWGSELKRKKAGETCGDHNVTLGSVVPWLKAEGATSNNSGLFLAPNMGFGCEDNGAVLQLPAPGAAPVAVKGTGRDAMLAALGGKDLRVEGVAVTADGKEFLVAVRSLDDALSHKLVRVTLESGAHAVVEVEAPNPPPAHTMGLSDVTVLKDGRVAVTVSREEDVDGKRVVSGELWVTTGPMAAGERWATQRVAVFEDHKPEGVVQLSNSCVVVLFDDDETYKAQQRAAQPDPKWDAAASFVSYVRVP